MIENPKQYTVLVTGATGQQGGAVARHLLDEGFHVRALTRNPNQNAARQLADVGAEVIHGDFLERSSLDRALNGAYGAYSVQNFLSSGVEGEIRQGTAFADAARDAGVEHFVYSSSAGAMPDVGVPHFESKWQIEKHISALGLPATILRPTSFMSNWVRNFKNAILDGQIPLPLSPDTALQQIAVSDIGAFATVAFTHPDEWKGRTVKIASDELTMMEMAKVFSRVIGRPVAYKQVSLQEFRKQVGEEIAIMFEWLEEDGYQANVESLRADYPCLKRLEQFLIAENWTSA